MKKLLLNWLADLWFCSEIEEFVDDFKNIVSKSVYLKFPFLTSPVFLIKSLKMFKLMLNELPDIFIAAKYL